MRWTDLRGPLLAGLLITLASWAFVSFVPAFAVWNIGDLRLYITWGNMLAQHVVPYRDFRIEYPPGALPWFAGPVYLHKLAGYHYSYYFWFRIQMLAVALFIVPAVTLALARLGASRRHAYAALAVIGLAPALLGPISVSRYDYVPALVTAVGIAALLAGWPTFACIAFAFGALTKIYPILLVPFALYELWRRRRVAGVARGIVATAVVLAAGTLPFIVLGRHGVSWALHRELARPIEVESLAATAFVAVHEVVGLHLHVIKSAGSDNLAGTGTRAAATLSGIVTALAVLLVYLRFHSSRRRPEDVVAAAAAVVTAYITFSKVLSPQYLLWLVPVVPLVDGRLRARLLVMLAVVLGMTQIWEPYRHGQYTQTFTPWLSWIVIARNVLLVVMFVMLVASVEAKAEGSHEHEAGRPRGHPALDSS